MNRFNLINFLQNKQFFQKKKSSALSQNKSFLWNHMTLQSAIFFSVLIGVMGTCSTPPPENPCSPDSTSLACCVKISETDTPDDPNSPLDQNCDGIDGNKSNAIFVDGFSGADQNEGSMEHPLKTISAGLKKAAGLGKSDVYVSTGVYQESLVLQNGVSVYGDYSATDGWSRSSHYTVLIKNPTVDQGPSVAVEGHGIFAPTILSDLQIQSASAVEYGQSSYGIHCVQCKTLTIQRSLIQAGDGAHGLNGLNGTNGQNGRDATNIDEVNNTFHVSPSIGGPSTIGREGGNGGGAGLRTSGGDVMPGLNGKPGSIGTPGGTGGLPAVLDTPQQVGPPGGNGTQGTDGVDGTNGAGGQTQGIPLASQITAAGYFISDNGRFGLNGTHGNGGGGGGGSGSTRVNGDNRFFQFGCVGGGGGAGGQAGTGASPGTGGGGSFGIFATQSDGMILQDTVVTAGKGGDGGTGGFGGFGGFGGIRGVGESRTQRFCGGGNGGFGGGGGNGGSGGHGGGGAGGPSFAVFHYFSNLAYQGKNLFFFNRPGVGGQSPANLGQTGLSGQIYP